MIKRESLKDLVLYLGFNKEPEGEIYTKTFPSCFLKALVVKTAYDFAAHNGDWVKLTFNNIVIQRTWRELNSEDCVPNEEMVKKKSICTSRSFNGMISDYDTLRTQVSNYAARCAEKLRQQ